MEMMNCSGTINVSLGYKTYRILVWPRQFGGTKIVFSCNFQDIGYAKFLITLLFMYLMLKITIGYYIYNINS